MPRNVVEGCFGPAETPHTDRKPRTPAYAAIRYSGESLKTKGSPVAVESRAEGITYPRWTRLLEKTDSKYSLVIEAARRARQINAYYSQLFEGHWARKGPLVGRASTRSPSIALREINDGLLETSTVTVEGPKPEPRGRPRCGWQDRRLQNR